MKHAYAKSLEDAALTAPSSIQSDRAASSITAPAVIVPRLPSVALIVDTDTWAFANISRQLIRYLSDDFNFRMIPAAVIPDVHRLLLVTGEADLRHFFWREIPLQIGAPGYLHSLDRLGADPEAFEERFISGRKLTTAIYDHLFLSERDVADRAAFFASSFLDAYSVSSQRLYEIYSSLPGYRPPTAVLEDGVDLESFTPRRLDRFGEVAGRGLVVGWVGNSAWNSETDDFKGVHTILSPGIEAVHSRGVAIRGQFADRQVRFISHAEMPEYYAQIDLLACTSKVEGTPNPILEAMACGVPVVTTDVGIVPQLLGPRQRDFVLPERTVEALADRLEELATHPALLEELSRENLDSIREWGWDRQAEQFKTFFRQVLEQ